MCPGTVNMSRCRATKSTLFCVWDVSYTSCYFFSIVLKPDVENW